MINLDKIYDLFYPAVEHRQCLEGLELAIRMRRGLSVIRGGIGVGKTTISRKLIQNFKDDGYFIICRRRVGLDDVNNRRHNSAENLKYNEFQKYIDLEISDWGGYPDVLFKLCYLADIMLLMDRLTEILLS